MSNYRPHDEPVAGYRLIELLGEGAFGAVWKGEGPGGVLVAMKIISKLNGIHAIREWQSLQAVKNLKHANLVNIYGVWLKDEQGHVLTTEEIQSLVPAEVVQQSPPTADPAPPPKPAKRGRPQRKPAIDPASSTLRCETLQVGDSPSSVPPHDLHNAETGSPSGTDSDGASATGSAGSGSQGSAGSRERWASLGDKVPPLELVSVMTLGDGTLLDRLKRCQATGQRGIPRPELMEHLRDAVKGLQFLNDRDVQHCDVKPENLLVVGGSVQVCDYGSALRSIYAKEARTSQGYTEQYAAPEQLGARRIKLHKTTDLYALAMTYYALRTGKFPWSDHADEPIPVLKYDERFDYSALARVSRFRFEADVLRRAMKRDPAQRQRSVSEFLADLERAIALESAAEAGVRRQRRRLVGWAAVAVLLVSLAAAGTYYREPLIKALRPSSDRERLALLLSNGQWGEALDLVKKSSTELSGDAKAIEETALQLKRALDIVPDVPGADGQMARALEVPEKFRSADIEAIIVRAACQPELDRGDFAGAAKSSQQISSLPALEERAGQEVFDQWLAAAEADANPAAAAAELAKMTALLPGFRDKIADSLGQRGEAALAELDRQLDSGPGSAQAVASNAQLLASAARDFNAEGAEAPDGKIKALEFEAELRGLAGRLQAGQDAAAILSDLERLQGELTSSGATDKVLAARVGLVAAAVSDDRRLEPSGLEKLAKLADDLGVTSATIGEPKKWDGALVKQLVDRAFDQAGARLAETGQLEVDLLAALGELPAGGSADLRLAKTLLVHASRADDNAEPLKQAAAWLQGSKSLKTQEEARAKAALDAWLALAEGGWFQPESLRTALAAFREWRQQGRDGALADETLAAVLAALVERADRHAASFAAAASPALATVDEALAANSQPEVAAPRRLLAEASLQLHLLRARQIALAKGLTKQDFATIQSDLTAIDAARAVLSAASAAGNDRLPPLAQPLAPLEIAALAVESHLHLAPEANERPAAVQAAWDSIAKAPADPASTAENYDADYISFVRDLAALRGWQSPPPAEALSGQAQSKSPWLAVPLRRQTAAAELMRQGIAKLPLPADLKFSETNGPAFAAASQRLALILAWDAAQPSARALVPICRMYERANPDWQAIVALSGPATSDASLVAALPAAEGLHLWLAHARSSENTATSPAGKINALAAYAAILRTHCDLYGQAGTVSPNVMYRELVQPALALVPRDADGDLPAEDSLRSAAAAVFGAQGVLLEDDFARDLAAAYFGYPQEPLKFAEATRDCFAAAARFEPDANLRLRWTTGQARAVDMILSRRGEEVTDFKAFSDLAAAIAGEWAGTFEAHMLQGIATHYKSRVAPTQADREKALADAYQRLAQAETALKQHPQFDKPWCQGWLSQCRESLSKVALEQSHLQPWGLEKQRLLNLAVTQAQQAAQVEERHRISPAACLLCEGNAYEDLAVHLFCLDNFEPAEQRFRAAVKIKLDPLVVRQSEAYLGRILVRRALLDPQIEADKAKAAAYGQEAIGLLQRASQNLREGRYQDLGLAHEAEFYLAEAHANFASQADNTPDYAEAVRLYERIGRELAQAGSQDHASYRIKAARCRVKQLAAQRPTGQQLASALADLAAEADAIEQELPAQADPQTRIDLMKLRISLIRNAQEYAVQFQRAERQLAILADQKDQASLEAQTDILLLAGRSKYAATPDIVARLRKVSAKLDSPEARLTTELSALMLEQPWLGEQAENERDGAKAFALAQSAIACAEKALALAGELEDLQVVVACTPELKKPRYDTEDAVQKICKRTLKPMGVLVSHGVARREAVDDARSKVRRWWHDAGLHQLTPEQGGPTAAEKLQFRNDVGM